MRAKVEQLVIASVGFFWAFLMWFSAAFLHLGLGALLIAAVYRWRGEPARDVETAEAVRRNTSL